METIVAQKRLKLAENAPNEANADLDLSLGAPVLVYRERQSDGKVPTR